MRHDNDNFDPFQSIGLQAKLIVNKLRISAQLSETDKQKKENTGSDTDAGRADEKDAAEQARYIEQRLRELAAFEKRVRGHKN